MEAYFDNLWLVRLLFLRGLAAVYLIAFISALNQFPALLGETGLLPVPAFLKRSSFRESPSLFHLFYSDRFFRAVAWLGIVLSLFGLLGVTERLPLWFFMAAWFSLWLLYLSIVNVGQTFYSFGWESMLLEAGFFAAFLGPSQLAPPLVPIIILRWMLFRVELGAGLIKLRYDRCWRDLTCLFYHYETQPLPNALSWYFHRLPKAFHRFGVLASHFVQVICPFGLFAPQPIATIAGALIIAHQLWLIVSGNYSWLNWLTVVLGMTALSDSTLASIIPVTIPPAVPRPLFFDGLLYALAGVVAVLSIKPLLNLLSRNQLMNYNYNSFHLVSAYGAFGSMTKERYEIVLEGTEEGVVTAQTRWREYGFRGKPVELDRRPPQVAPYHLRLDWLLWFLPFSVMVRNGGVIVYGHELWFVRLIKKLLEGNSQILGLFRFNPFREKPPQFVRARFYLYCYTDWQEKKKTGTWWRRKLIDEYMLPVSLEQLERGYGGL